MKKKGFWRFKWRSKSWWCKCCIWCCQKQIQKWLNSVDSYMLHKPIRRKFQVNREIVYSFYHEWETDLMDLGRLQKFSQEYHYLLTVINILLKYQWAILLKSKKGEETEKAFQSTFKSRSPSFFRVIQGANARINFFPKNFITWKGSVCMTFNNAKA